MGVTASLPTAPPFRLTVSFRTVRTSTLSDDERRATDALRTAWTLAEPAT